MIGIKAPPPVGDGQLEYLPDREDDGEYDGQQVERPNILLRVVPVFFLEYDVEGQDGHEEGVKGGIHVEVAAHQAPLHVEERGDGGV
jgi:hypothetical protein